MWANTKCHIVNYLGRDAFVRDDRYQDAYVANSDTGALSEVVAQVVASSTTDKHACTLVQFYHPRTSLREGLPNASRRTLVSLLLVIASALLAVALFIVGAIWRGRMSHTQDKTGRLEYHLPV